MNELCRAAYEDTRLTDVVLTLVDVFCEKVNSVEKLDVTSFPKVEILLVRSAI